MITIENVEDFPARARGAYVTVGNFDGVHRGHQRLIGRLRPGRCRGRSGACRDVQSAPGGTAASRQGSRPPGLADREIALLEEAGATEVAVFRTGRWLLDLTAREFFDRVIRRRLVPGAWSKAPTSPSATIGRAMWKSWAAGVPRSASNSRSSSRSATTPR